MTDLDTDRDLASVVLVDDPAPQVRRITLNRPEKRNALNHELRGGVLRALEEADRDPEVRVSIVRGAGKCFSSGYDLGGGNEGQELPFFTAGGDGQWPRLGTLRTISRLSLQQDDSSHRADNPLGQDAQLTGNALLRSWVGTRQLLAALQT